MTMHRPSLLALAGALLLGCPGGNASDSSSSAESGSADSSGSTSAPTSESLSNSESNSNSETDPTTETTLTTDPDSSSTDPTGSESSSGGIVCTEKDECILDGDCLPGQSCLDCLCFGEPTGRCAEYGEGAFGDCLDDEGMVDNAVCMSDTGQCVVDDPQAPTAGVCFFSGCVDVCDCPAPPEGFEAQLSCDNVTAGDEEPDCYIACGPEECPEGMYCVGNTLCMFGEPPPTPPPYGDCVEAGVGCDGVCLSNNPMDPAWGFCGGGCMGDDDCAVPKTGDAMPVCIDYSGEGDMACALVCGQNTVCPDGMFCQAQFDICVWDVGEPYANCLDAPTETCVPGHTCVTNEEGVNGICGAPCDDVMTCDAAPATGNAVLTCGDLGAGNVCHLSCAMGETCPDGTACIDNLFCAYEA